MSSRSSVSRQAKAGVTLSVARINTGLRRGRVAKHVSSRAPLYTAGVLETIVDSIMKQTAENVLKGPRDKKGVLVSRRIGNADLINVVRSDPDLARLYSGFAFASNAPAIKPIGFILSSEGQKKRREQKDARKAKANGSGDPMG